MADKTWDTSKPAAADAPSSSDDDLRDASLGIKERLDVDHEMGHSAGTLVNTETEGAGHHKAIHLDEQADPTVAANHIAVYGKLADGKCQLFIKNEDGNVKQLTKLGKLLVVHGDLYTDVADEATIEVDGTNGLQLKNDGVVVTGTTSKDIAKFANLTSNYGPPGACFVGTWAACNAADLKTVTHNLGSKDLIIRVQVADDGSGNNCRDVPGWVFISSARKMGAQVQTITNTTLKVQFATHSIVCDMSAAGAIGTNVASGYFRVIAMKVN